MIQRGYAGGGKTQHETVEGQMVKATPPQGEAIIGVVATQAMATVEVFEFEHGPRGFCHCGSTDDGLRLGWRDPPPETCHPNQQRQNGKTEDTAKHQSQGVMRKNRIKIACQS